MPATTIRTLNLAEAEDDDIHAMLAIQQAFAVYDGDPDEGAPVMFLIHDYREGDPGRGDIRELCIRLGISAASKPSSEPARPAAVGARDFADATAFLSHPETVECLGDRTLEKLNASALAALIAAGRRP